MTSGFVCELVNNILVNSNFSNIVGQLIVNGDNVEINNCIFKNIHNKQTNGGAIFVKSGEYVFIGNCIFINNTALNGGAVYIHNVTDSSYILNSVFINNTASNLGGAVYVEPGIYYFISESTRKTFNTTLKFNDLYDLGTLVYMEDVWVAHDVVEANGTYDDPTGFNDAFNKVSFFGTIHFRYENETFDYTLTPLQKTCVKFNVTFMGNNTTFKGLTFVCSEYATGITFNNFIFSDYSQDSVFIWNGDEGYVVNCTFINNGGYDVGNGSAFRINADNVRIINCSFINNTAGLIDSNGGAIYCNGTNLLIDNCTFMNNKVYDSGSHIYLTEDSVRLNIWNSVFIEGNSLSNNHRCSGLYIIGSKEEPH